MKKSKYKRKFFVKMALCTLIMVSCFIFHSLADAPSAVQSSPIESVNKTETEEHLFFGMPFGSSLEFCAEILEVHFTEVFRGKSEDGIYASLMIENSEGSFVIGEPSHIYIDFQENQMNRVDLSYPAFDIKTENNCFDRLMAALTQTYGTPTDAYMITFGEVPNITYYHFPVVNDRYDMEKAMLIFKEKGKAHALCFLFDNVMFALSLSETNQNAFYCSISYGGADVTSFEKQRVDYQ